MEANDPLLLAGDIGGTKTDLAIVAASQDPREPLARHRYPNEQYHGLEEIAHEFLRDTGLRVQAASFAVAGPVVDGRAQLTNLPWQLDERSLAPALGLDRVWLLNDLVATASAVPVIHPGDLYVVKQGQPAPGGPIAVIAPGTGLGEAFLTVEGSGYRAHGSEGGHAAFAPTNELELDLLRALWEEFDHVSFERVASGVGIPNLYAFLRDRKGIPESPQLAELLAGTEDQDRTRPIVQAALDENAPDLLATATVELFLGILGGEAANLALKVLGTGGVYLAGGIAQALRDKLGRGPFVDAFGAGGRFSAMLEQIPVYVVIGEVALLGAGVEGLRMLRGGVS
jgi:glucokinase